jgi:hypothetical protein
MSSTTAARSETRAERGEESDDRKGENAMDTDNRTLAPCAT